MTSPNNQQRMQDDGQEDSDGTFECVNLHEARWASYKVVDASDRRCSEGGSTSKRILTSGRNGCAILDPMMAFRHSVSQSRPSNGLCLLPATDQVPKDMPCQESG